jgi:nitric oxide reductase NorQ protein
MGRTRTRECDRVYAAVDSLAQSGSGESLRIEGIRERLRLQGIEDLGAGMNYLRRALHDAITRGEVVQRGHTYAFGGSHSTVNPLTNDEMSMDGMVSPEVDPTFVLPASVQAYLPVAQERLLRGEHMRFRVTGPTGSGKTESGLQFAAALGLDAIVIDCSIIREPRDFFGSRTVRDGRVVWVDSQFARAVAKGGCMIVLDEVNRCSDLVANALLPLLDRRQATLIEERGSVLRAGPGIVWWATQNEGMEYTGTGSIDRAVRDRFQRVIECGYLPARDECKLLRDRTGVDPSVAASLVEVASRTRSEAGALGTVSAPLSTRQLLAAAEDYRDGGASTLTATIANAYPAGDERSVIAALLSGKFA